MSTEEYIDIRKFFSVKKDASYDPDSKTVTLTPDEPDKIGAITGTTRINLKYDFTLVADINIGKDPNAGNGIAIGFHQGLIDFVGTDNGIKGAPDGVAFLITPYPDLNHPSSGRRVVYGYYEKTNDLTTLGYAPELDPIIDANWRPITLQWNSYKQQLTASFYIKSELVHWELNKDDYAIDIQKYTFIIGASTEKIHNKHQIRIKKFDAQFVPRITAQDTSIKQGEAFDPLHDPSIKLKAIDANDGDITQQIQVVENKVDSSIPGEHKVTYAVKNSVGESDETTIKVTVIGKPKITANDISINQDASFDPLHDPSIELKATDAVDGDITKKIQVENTVDSSKPGEYKVTYTVKNSLGGSEQKTIKVTVIAKPIIAEHWENLEVKGWKLFSGVEIKLVKDPDKVLKGEWALYTDQHTAIYKEIRLQSGKKYKLSVSIKPKDESLLASHYVKIFLKANHASQSSRTLVNMPLSQGETIQKGYRRIEAEFTAQENEDDPLFIVENFNAGWIDSIKIARV
jgi:hypothetical protein